MTITPDLHLSLDTALDTALSPDQLASLRAEVVGDVLVAGDEGYDTHRACWNLAFTHRPDVVVVAHTTADVVAAVLFARTTGRRLAVQTTGHGVARTAESGSVLVDLSRLVGVRIDPVTRTATFGGGCTWAPVLEAAAAHGLAPLLGSTPHVGAVGYTLGGGLGWLARPHGMCRDTLRSAEIVTLDGDLVVADEHQHAELFWALRGGGTAGIGVVVSMTVALVAVDHVYAGNLLYPAEMAPQVVRRYAEWVATTPTSLTSSVVVMNFPPLEVVPEPLRGQSFVMVRGCFDGPLEEGRALIDDWRAWAEPAIDMFGPMPFSMVATISNDPVDPMPAVVSTEWLTGLTDDVVDEICGATLPAGGPPALTFSEVRHVGTAAMRGDGPELGGATEFLLEIVAAIPFPEAEIAAREAIAALRAALAPSTTGGTYLNFTEGEEKRVRTRSGFAETSLQRLRAVKDAQDPHDVMCHGIDVAGRDRPIGA